MNFILASDVLKDFYNLSNVKDHLRNTSEILKLSTLKWTKSILKMSLAKHGKPTVCFESKDFESKQTLQN